MTTTPQYRTDQDVQREVTEELEWIAGLDLADVGVSVHDGAVTLDGAVSDLPQRKAVVKAALRVRGVTAVADELEVRLPDSSRISDSDIADAVQRGFRDSVEVPHDAVHATVRDGVVTLLGTVRFQYERRAARRIAEHARGARAVDSRIELARRPSAPDAAERVRNAIRRNAAVDAAHVDVRIDGTEAVLTGTVRSFAERSQAERAAWTSPHVTAVRNLIEVRG
ncbi:MAG TPA: BON domain-containing protein [Amnibacterium sp.]|jgi:osmotically-inducible protein OsmY|uniref:BON domain-containing protein n=1 Tax=Amnibacterium sp. TaxID=1872496 RepID=UPI002F940062